MNGSEVKYNQEYVEIQTALEHIRTKVESIDVVLRDFPQTILEIRSQIEKNRSEISTIKSTAMVLGGLAGSCITALFRFILNTRGG